MSAPRQDMRNVNNWHWVDKNCIVWTKDYWKEKLTGLSFENADKTRVEIADLADLTGDVDLNQRKGKVITIFDFALELKWKGTDAAGLTATGRIKIPEYMHDTELDEIVFDVTTDSDSKAKEPIKKVLKTNLLPLIREKFAAFTKDLTESHTKDVYIELAENKPTSCSAYKPAPPAPELVTKSVNNGVVGATTTIDIEVELVASSSDVYNTLLDKKRVAVWTRNGNAQIEAKVGSPFVLFDGNITGSIEGLEENRSIVKKWRLRSWPKDHYSTVTITLEDKGDATMVKLVQTGVPIGEKDQVKTNWSHYYFHPIKAAFGFGANLS